MAIDTEKIAAGGAFSGISTKAGDLLTLRVKGQNKNIDLETAKTHKLHYALYHDSILEIQDSGVIILE